MSKDNFGDEWTWGLAVGTHMYCCPTCHHCRHHHYQAKKKSHPDRGLHIPIIPSLEWLKLNSRMVSSRPA